MGRTKIKIDYSVCGDGNKIDPRECSHCRLICDPAIFLMHETLGVELDEFDPQIWRITPIWTSLCNRCLKCVEICPENVIKVSW